MPEGVQFPSTPSLEVVSSTGAVAFWQIELGIAGKVGTRLFTIVMLTETGLEQEPADGVNV
jgi:hypothetical protein